MLMAGAPCSCSQPSAMGPAAAAIAAATAGGGKAPATDGAAAGDKTPAAPRAPVAVAPAAPVFGGGVGSEAAKHKLMQQLEAREEQGTGGCGGGRVVDKGQCCGRYGLQLPDAPDGVGGSCGMGVRKSQARAHAGRPLTLLTCVWCVRACTHVTRAKHVHAGRFGRFRPGGPRGRRGRRGEDDEGDDGAMTLEEYEALKKQKAAAAAAGECAGGWGELGLEGWGVWSRGRQRSYRSWIWVRPVGRWALGALGKAEGVCIIVPSSPTHTQVRSEPLLYGSFAHSLSRTTGNIVLPVLDLGPKRARTGPKAQSQLEADEALARELQVRPVA